MAGKQQSVLQAVWRLSPGPLEEGAVARRLFECARAVMGVEFHRYDLNQRGQWKPYHEEALVVDAVTQRTQTVQIEGRYRDDSREIAPREPTPVMVVATGKHGEAPQAVARWEEGWDPGRRMEIEEALRTLDGLPLEEFRLGAPDGDPLVVVTEDGVQVSWNEEER